MSELISGKDALIAIGEGRGVEFKDGMDKWENVKHHMNLDLSMFLTPPHWIKFRLKPQTTTINGVELENPKNIEKPTVTSILLCFNSEPERNVFLNTLMNRNF